ncbi:hypothetical protein ONZ45_g6075 [Pleurotus djamor]|nr:hypothetical protein ONZ45_g6075 [Pleurotus djamor]
MPSLLQVPSTSPHLSVSQTSTLIGSESSFTSSDGMDGLDEFQKLESLRTQLTLENSIKEGAEDLLKKDITDALRQQVQSELSNANRKIDALVRRIEQYRIHPSPSARPENSIPLTDRGSRTQTTVQKAKERGVSQVALQRAIDCLNHLSSLDKPNPQSPTPADTTSEWIEAMQKLVVILRRHFRVRYELEIAEVLKTVIPALSDGRSQQCRSNAYRLIRYMLVDVDSVQRVGKSLDWYIVKSLSRDNKHTMEKEQVVKLIRSMVEVGSIRRDAANRPGKVPLSEAIMRALIAVAEYAEDPFRSICILTLTEILLIDIELASTTGAMRLLLNALGDGPLELAPILASAFLHIADSPRTRAYLRLGYDLELALSAVTDAYGQPPDHISRMRGCIKVIQLMLRTWSGLMYFCMDNLQAIRSLVNTLRIPSLETRDIILDMFFDLLNIRVPDWHKLFLDGKRLTRLDNFQATPELPSQGDAPERPSQRLRLTDQYIALLILILTEAGLFEALMTMLEENVTGSNLSRKATLLIAEILQLGNRVLPLSMAAKLQTVPHLFSLASDYGSGDHRIVGTLALSAIDSFNRNRTRLDPALIKNTRPRSNSLDDSARRQRQIEQVKIKLGMQMDEKTFMTILNESQISSTKEHARWQFDTLIDLVEGPLRNPSRLEEAIKASRIIRRLMSFFHPRSHRFSDIPRSRANQKWVRLGCALLTTLLASPDGVRYLSTEDVLLQQIVWGFSQLDPFNGPPDSDPIFSKNRVAETLTYGYFEMLGTLSKHKEGTDELRSREDLIKHIIENLDYNIPQHIRLYATRHLGQLVNNSSSVNAWTLRLLVTQLYDPSPEVCQLAAHLLKEACESKEALQLVVEMQPMMDHLGEIGHPLLMKFTSTLMGFRYLYDTGYIDKEMDAWYHERNIDYVVQVEVFLAKVFRSASPGDEEETLAFDGTVPPHFYGEMAKTELGCQVLQDKGHFADFAQFIRQHSHENEDAELILKLKSILWVVGNIGATEGGLPFLEEEHVIPAILEIAEESPIPSVRGTCFFVLGLISSTSQGAEILDDYRWEATLSPLGLPTGLCIPLDLERFISLPPWREHVSDLCASRLLPPSSEAETEVMTAIQNLANTVIANAASRSLTKMKSRSEYKQLFTSPALFYRALHIISTQRYRLPVRRYILDLFSVDLNQDTIAAIEKHAESLQAKSPSVPNKHDANRMSAAMRGKFLFALSVATFSRLTHAVNSQAYTWKNVKIGGGGGFIPGIVFNEKQQGLAYARTDIGGAYRLNPADDTWIPLLDWVGDADWNKWGVDALATDPVDPNRLYLATGMYTNSWDPNNGNILKSTDYGATFTSVPLPFKVGGNMAGRGMGERLAVDPHSNNILYYGTRSGNGLYKSTDFGSTWTQVANFPSVGSYMPDPNDPWDYNNIIIGLAFVTFDSTSGTAGSPTPRIFIGVADVGVNNIFVSEDAGATWAPVPGQITTYLPHKAVLSPSENTLYVSYSDGAGPYDGAAGAVYKYHIPTSTWTDITPVSGGDLYFGFGGLAVDVQSPGTIMVAALNSWWPDGQIFRSTDSGATWSPFWSWNGYPNLVKHYSYDSSLAPWIHATPYVETNPGTLQIGWMMEVTNIEALVIDPFDSDHWLYGTGGTIYGSHDLTRWDAVHNVTLKVLADGIEETSVRGLISPPTGPHLVSAIADLCGFYHDNLDTVRPQTFQTPKWMSSADIDYAGNKPTNLVRIGYNEEEDLKQVAYSSDSGQTWNQHYGAPAAGGGKVAYSADADTILWRTDGNGVLVSRHQATFSAVPSLPSDAAIASDKKDNTIFYGASGNTFYISTNYGATFTSQGTLGSSTSVHDILVNPGVTGDVWVSTDAGLFHSTNSGVSFTAIAGVSRAWAIGFGAPATTGGYPALFAGANIDGIGYFRTDDAGVNWVKINDAQHNFGAISANPVIGDPRVHGRVYIGTNGRGIFYGDATGSQPPNTATAGPTSSSSVPSSVPPTSSTSVPPTSSSSSVPPTSSSSVPVTSNPPTSSTSAPTPTGTASVWGQCGGQGYTGPTICAAGSTCTYSNPWYSQCLP